MRVKYLRLMKIDHLRSVCFCIKQMMMIDWLITVYFPTLSHFFVHCFFSLIQPVLGKRIIFFHYHLQAFSLFNFYQYLNFSAAHDYSALERSSCISLANKINKLKHKTSTRLAISRETAIVRTAKKAWQSYQMIADVYSQYRAGIKLVLSEIKSYSVWRSSPADILCSFLLLVKSKKSFLYFFYLMNP